MKTTPRILADGINTSSQGFEDFFTTLRPSLKLWDYFVNWDKVFRYTKQNEVYLNLWNFLLGKENFETELYHLLEEHPNIVKALPSLIVRDGASSNSFAVVENLDDLSVPDSIFDFSIPADSPELREKVYVFMVKSGLERLFKKNGVKNLVDYVLGVEAGLDSNGRKNRSGTSMETVVEAYIKKFCKGKELDYIPQASQADIKEKWGFVIPVEKATRRFDFAISNGKKLIIMEVNFYGGGGSKLKATAGEYQKLAEQLNVKDVKFVWITDGQGWETTKLPLKAAYETIDYIWNLAWLGRGYLNDLI
jgi:hypothetical protein